MLTINTHPHPRALIVWLHGLGASGEDLSPLAENVLGNNDYAVLHILPNAPSQPVSLNNQMIMPAWYDIYKLDMNAKQDQQGIQASAENLEQKISALHHQYDSIQQTFLIGFSQGGALALYMALYGELKYDGIIGLSTYLPVHDQLSSCSSARVKNLPILMLHGTEDEVIPMAYALFSRDQLSSAGASLTWGQYSVGHGVHPNGVIKMQQWLQSRLNKD